MTDKQPKALSLADWLDEVNAVPHPIHTKSAAAELRRLHEANESMRKILQRMLNDKGFMCECGIGNELFDAVEVLLRRDMI